MQATRGRDSGTRGQLQTLDNLARDVCSLAADDTNLYRYVGNRPVGSTDPSGLWEDRYGSGGSGAQWMVPPAKSWWEVAWYEAVRAREDAFGMVTHPVATAQGYYKGIGHGSAMVANAATFHQIDPLDTYVDTTIEQNGGLYSVANASAHVGVYAGYAAAGVWAWQAVGLPTAGVGVGPGQPVHLYYQVASGTSSGWYQGVAGGWIIGPAAVTPPMWGSLTGIPIFFPAAAMSLNYAWFQSYPCASAVVQAFVAGLTNCKFGF